MLFDSIRRCLMNPPTFIGECQSLNPPITWNGYA